MMAERRRISDNVQAAALQFARLKEQQIVKYLWLWGVRFAAHPILLPRDQEYAEPFNKTGLISREHARLKKRAATQMGKIVRQKWE